MSYIPANPHFAIVNCKIGDLNLTPIPPDTLESFTYERDTNNGAGNKFSIVVHDETAILMESYLAEAAFKAMQNQGYEFDFEGENIYDGNKLKDEYVDINKKPTPERVYLTDENSDEDEPSTISYKVNLMSLDDVNDVSEMPAFYQSTYSSNGSESSDELQLRRDESNHISLRNRDINENRTAFSSMDGDTYIISGGTGRSSTDSTSPIYDTNYRTVIPLKIDNSKLDYSDPSSGIRELDGYRLNDNVWMSKKAIAEFMDGSDPDDPES